MKYKITYRKTITDPIEITHRLNDLYSIFERKSEEGEMPDLPLNPFYERLLEQVKELLEKEASGETKKSSP